MKINQVLHLIGVNMRNFFREPGALFWSFAFPIAMAWVLGLAFSNTPEKKYTVYLLGDSTAKIAFHSSEKEFEKKLGTGTDLKVVGIFKTTNNKQVITKALQKGTCLLYIELSKGKPVFRYDPNNSEANTLFLLLDREIALLSGREVLLSEKITTKGTRYIDFLIPGLLALGIMNSCVWGISWYLIELRIKKLLRRMVITPMQKSAFIASHFITRLLLSLFESSILIGFAKLFFGVTITGSILALAFIYLAGILAFGGIGLILATRTQSTHVGNGLINAIVLPMTILSGIFFSYQNFPEWAIPIIKYLPLTILSDTIRAIFNQGADLNDVLAPGGILIASGVLFYWIGLKLFKWY